MSNNLSDIKPLFNHNDIYRTERSRFAAASARPDRPDRAHFAGNNNNKNDNDNNNENNNNNENSNNENSNSNIVGPLSRRPPAAAASPRRQPPPAKIQEHQT